MPGTSSYEIDLRNAKYLLGGSDFKEFSFTHDYPEFSTTIPLEELKKVGDEFEFYGSVNRNIKLFSYPGFYLYLVKFLLFHPLSIIEALYLRYIIHRTKQMSLLAVLKDCMQFQKSKFSNP